MARTKGASPGSKPAKSSDKNSPKKSKGQDTEAAFFTFLEDKKKRIPGISLAGAMNAWKALPKLEQESYKLRSKQQKNASHDGTDNSQEQRVYKMLIEGDGEGKEEEGDGVGSGVGSSAPMAIEQEAIFEVPAEPMDVSTGVAESTASTTTITETTIVGENTTMDAGTTTVTSTATVIVTEQPSTVIPAEVLPAVTIQEQGQEQRGPVIVDATSEPFPAPVPSPDLQAQQVQLAVLPPPLPFSALQEDEGYVMVESGGDSIPSAPIVPCNDVVVCTAQDIEKGPGFEAPAKEAPPVIDGQPSPTEPETPAAPVPHANTYAPGPVDAGAAGAGDSAIAPEAAETSIQQE